ELFTRANVFGRMLVVLGAEIVGGLDHRVKRQRAVLTVLQELVEMRDALAGPKVGLAGHLRYHVTYGRGLQEVGVVELPGALEARFIQAGENAGAENARVAGSKYGMNNPTHARSQDHQSLASSVAALYSYRLSS